MSPLSAEKLKEIEKAAAEAARRIVRTAELKKYALEWIGYKYFNTEYKFSQVEKYLDDVVSDLQKLESISYPVFKHVNKREVYNIPCSFDIETSSYKKIKC